MAEHFLHTENFSLRLSLTTYDDEVLLPSNTIMTAFVSCDGFSAEAPLDIDIKEFQVFANDLVAVCKNLNGEAVIREPFGAQKFISFRAKRTGHIRVKGFLCDDKGNNQLHFQASVEPNPLLSFSIELASDFATKDKE